MLDFRSQYEVNDRDKEEVGVEYLLDFRQLNLTGQLELKCFADVVSIGQFHYILGGGRSQYFSKLGYIETGEKQMSLYQKGVDNVITQKETKDLWEQMKEKYKKDEEKKEKSAL